MRKFWMRREIDPVTAWGRVAARVRIAGLPLDNWRVRPARRARRPSRDAEERGWNILDEVLQTVRTDVFWALSFLSCSQLRMENPFERSHAQPWLNQMVRTRERLQRGRNLGTFCEHLIVSPGNKRCVFPRNLEAPPGIEPGMEVLQTSALPLGDGAI